MYNYQEVVEKQIGFGALPHDSQGNGKSPFTAEERQRHTQQITQATHVELRTTEGTELRLVSRATTHWLPPSRRWFFHPFLFVCWYFGFFGNINTHQSITTGLIPKKPVSTMYSLCVLVSSRIVVIVVVVVVVVLVVDLTERGQSGQVRTFSILASPHFFKGLLKGGDLGKC